MTEHTSVLIAILFVAALGACTYADTHYYIVPDHNTALCHGYPQGNCFTLDRLESHVSNNDFENITLSFLPGEYVLSWTISFKGVSSITLTKEQNGNGNTSPTITCNGSMGFDFTNAIRLNIENLVFAGCKRNQNGGAFSLSNIQNVSIKSCTFYDCHVTGQKVRGGAIYFMNIASLSVTNSRFRGNSASCFECEGGAVYMSEIGTIGIDSSIFELNTANISGGAITLSNHRIQKADLNITHTRFVSNRVQPPCTDFLACGYGGAINIMMGGSVTISKSFFVNNYAIVNGGAIHIQAQTNALNNFSSIANVFESNSAINGGAICAISFFVYTINSSYTDNFSTDRGGTIYSDGALLFSLNNIYKSNRGSLGGVIFNKNTPGKITADYFQGNKAQLGAAIYQTLRQKLEISDSIFFQNTNANEGSGVVYLRLTTLICTGTIYFTENQGSVFAFNSQLEFQQRVTFANQTSQLGGAITGTQSVITFKSKSTTTIIGNTASYGGAIALTESSMYSFGSITITHNRATQLGGGIYAYQSHLEFRTETLSVYGMHQNTNITDNFAEQHGGGVYLAASDIKISESFVHIYSNRAKLNGGGFYLEQNSNIHLNKQIAELTTKCRVKLDFQNNTAIRGGAIYVVDSGLVCNGVNSNAQKMLTSVQCFLQTLSLYDFDNIGSNFINTFFTNNTAKVSGGDIYGGLFDRCTVSPQAELFEAKTAKEINTPLNGLNYLTHEAQFDWDKTNHISSDAVQLCFCIGNNIYCNYTHPVVSVKKGEKFTLSVVAVDQVGSPVNATVISSFELNSGVGRFKEGQENQHVRNQCTDVEYNVYSTYSLARIQLYANGPCGNMGISKRNVNVTFLPCTCPIGFQPTLPTTDCICDCNQLLRPYVSNCSLANKTIQIDKNVWIKYINTSNNSGFLIQNCPFDFCAPKPVNVSLLSHSTTDKQCAFNRTGNLCGICANGLSLVFASSKCRQCSNYYLFLLLPVALAGIALTTLILLLNMTVATGTINGLIFYANIVAANRSIFLSFDSPNFLTVFISWLNLDLGIETCFYNGMDSYGKILLQLVFPAYLFVLIGTIIMLCEYSDRLSTLLGKRNPVAALSTLILLSYSKLILTIILALQYTTLHFPDGSVSTVWLYDANVPYFKVSHIPRFIASAIIIVLGTMYTTLLFFGQWFLLCSNWKIMKWVNKPRYNSFIDAYHAPLSPRQRYWVGLLLLARIIHCLVSAFTSEAVTILSAGIIVLGLMLLKLVNKTTYKNLILDILETSFLMNLAILSLSTFYVREVEHGDQATLAYTSMTVSFVTFLGIVCYHFGKYILKTRHSSTILQQYQRIKYCCNKRAGYELVPVVDEEPISDQEPDEEDSGEEFQETGPQPVYTDNNTNEIEPPPPMFEPPIITSCVPVDQFREPLLEDPTTEDYSKPAKTSRCYPLCCRH